MFLKSPVRNNLDLYPIAEMIYNDVYQNPCAIQQGFFFQKVSTGAHLFSSNAVYYEKKYVMFLLVSFNYIFLFYLYKTIVF